MSYYKYQNNYSENMKYYNYEGRQQKANKIIAVLKDYLKRDLKHLKLLDIGSSTGIMTKLLSEHLNETIGIDIDEQGVRYSNENFKNDHLSFMVDDAMSLSFS